jgi:hypothetical protein
MIPNLNRTDFSIPVVDSVRLEYYSNRTLWSASIGTVIPFGSRSETPSGKAIRLENVRDGSVRFEDVWYGQLSLEAATFGRRKSIGPRYIAES